MNMKGEDFFAIFGEREEGNILNSKAYTQHGLAYKGPGKTIRKKEDPGKIVEQSGRKYGLIGM